MLFNSYSFVLGFLPLSLVIFHALRHFGLERTSILALTLLSLFFYGWWNAIYLLLLVPLMLANYALAKHIVPVGGRRRTAARGLLIAGVSGNLAVLAYFKYANFFVDNLNISFGIELFLAQILLPLGISFFVFQKIAFLVDAYRGRVEHLNLLDYGLFVTFFPQLIAGPIVHHSEVLPQFLKRGRVSGQEFALGLVIFAIGLAKKVLLADTAGAYVAAPFDAAAAGASPGALSAWSGALAYTAQLYFDFSGYSDMAIGAALLFGIRLPVNFASPYKATSIIDFWRRWHITLSRFLRDYLYVSLGGNRLGAPRRYVNLFLTMLLGGFWHGAGWTFVIWGALHGFYLIVNHAWRAIRRRVTGSRALPGRVETRLGQALTFLAVVVAWVFFRAKDAASALVMLKAMAGMDLSDLPRSILSIFTGVQANSGTGLLVALGLLLLAWVAPNTQELVGYVGPKFGLGTEAGESHASRPLGRLSPRWALGAGALVGLSIMSLSKVSEFLYFRF